MRLQNILVATDLSRAAESVYRWAAAVARRFGGRVTLVNVDETSQFDWPARSVRTIAGLERLLDELSQNRKDKLQEARRWFEEQDIPTRSEVVVGRASDRIVDRAGWRGTDLVVMGKRGVRQLERFSMGSTTKRVLRRVDVPTLVVPREGKGEPYEPFSGGRIICATAFSAACLMTLDATLELAEAAESHVDYVHVIRLPTPFSVNPAEWPAIVGGETHQELEHMHAKDLSHHIGQKRVERCTPYSTLGVSVSHSLRDLALETGADLITISAHSSGTKNPPLLGSTTERVVKHSPVPVLVFSVSYLERRFGLSVDAA